MPWCQCVGLGSAALCGKVGKGQIVSGCWEKLPGTLDTDGGPFGQEEGRQAEWRGGGGCPVNQFGGFISRVHLLSSLLSIHGALGST